jgi:hypothetical protein
MDRMDGARARRMVTPPPGCEDCLTRHEVAALLGFASEYKVRQLERRGRLSAVRGAMGTAFYRRAAVLALKVELERRAQLVAARPSREVTDPELLALLARPGATAADLVVQAGVDIERAERVFAFWRLHGASAHAPAPVAPSPRAEATIAMAATIALPAELGAAAAAALEECAPASMSGPPSASAPGPGRPGASDIAVGAPDRRSTRRQSRAELLAQLRDPRPAIRAAAFAALRA